MLAETRMRVAMAYAAALKEQHGHEAMPMALRLTERAVSAGDVLSAQIWHDVVLRLSGQANRDPASA